MPACLFYLKDQLKPEPFKLVIKVFIIGGLVVFPLIVVQSILAPYNGGIWIESFLLSGLFEEFIKWFLLYFLIYNHTEFDEFFDGIVYAVAIAAGFATVENLFMLF
ncbi:PrsW family intramembrane metalloprotease [Paenibacillus sp. JMULE4]|uniref:PrsW family glutamic-type intramembrane protease n=1 Tax=Paenibacillus sp. JMULE4 TaxID=2518342 RepID=UPI0015764566|nr:PrsW family intramembrane metalloprotease [Paenibacillus sp. JMULE4]